MLLAAPQFAVAQRSDIPGFDSVKAQIQAQLNKDHITLTEGVELTQGTMKFTPTMSIFRLDQQDGRSGTCC